MKLNLRTLAATTALLLGSAGLAQAQSTSGNIQGVAAAGDTIVVQGTSSGFTRELAITEDGKYSIRRVPTGSYTVTSITENPAWHYTVVQKHADGSAEAPKPVQIHAGVTVRVQ